MRAAIAALLLLACAPAIAQEARPGKCHPVEAVIAMAQGAVQHVERLNPDQAARAVDWWNRQPPESSDHYDTALIVIENSGRVSLFLGDAGQICVGGPVPPQLHNSLITAIMGREV